MEVNFRYPSGHPINSETDLDRVGYAVVGSDDIAVLVRWKGDYRCERCPPWYGADAVRDEPCPHEAAVADEVERRWEPSRASESLLAIGNEMEAD